MSSEDNLFSDEGRDSEAYPLSSLSDKAVFTTPSDPDVETIINRIEEGSIVLRPRFQRGSVWDDRRKSKLIESLILNLPIPPCFFAEDEDDTRIVVDGQQRLIAIDDFYHGRYSLTGLEVLSQYNGSTWNTLPNRLDRKILQRVIRTLVISQHTPEEIRFEIFERLNTGAVPLTDQEIRNATLSGPLNDLLDNLAHEKLFLQVIRKSQPDERLRHHELILRYLALSSELCDYNPPFRFFLTNFMKVNRRSSIRLVNDLYDRFMSALTISSSVFEEDVFRKFRAGKDGLFTYERTLNRAVFDVQMLSFTGIPVRLIHGHETVIRQAFEKLSVLDDDFISSLSRATDHRSRLTLRLRMWFSALEGIGVNVPLAKELAEF